MSRESKNSTWKPVVRGASRSLVLATLGLTVGPMFHDADAKSVVASPGPAIEMQQQPEVAVQIPEANIVQDQQQVIRLGSVATRQ